MPIWICQQHSETKCIYKLISITMFINTHQSERITCNDSRDKLTVRPLVHKASILSAEIAKNKQIK